MAYDPHLTQSSSSGARTIDAGLQAYMQSVYNTMGLGLALTGLSAFAVANIPALYNAIFHTMLYYIVALAPLVVIMVGFTPRRVATMPINSLLFTFSIIAVLTGASLATIFHVFTGSSIARVFFITAGAFAATSLYGYTTRRDLSGIGSFMFMGLTGIVLASLANLIMQSSMVYFVTSVIGVFVFTGLAAWNTQFLKSVYRTGETDANTRVAISGALNMYLSFINLFQILLSFMGDRRN